MAVKGNLFDWASILTIYIQDEPHKAFRRWFSLYQNARNIYKFCSFCACLFRLCARCLAIFAIESMIFMSQFWCCSTVGRCKDIYEQTIFMIRGKKGNLFVLSIKLKGEICNVVNEENIRMSFWDGSFFCIFTLLSFQLLTAPLNRQFVSIKESLNSGQPFIACKSA